MLETYSYDHAFTNAVIQHGRAKAKLIVFGDADHNVQYAQVVYCKLKDMSHLIEYVYSKRSKVVSKLGHVRRITIRSMRDYTRLVLQSGQLL